MSAVIQASCHKPLSIPKGAHIPPRVALQIWAPHTAPILRWMASWSSHCSWEGQSLESLQENSLRPFCLVADGSESISVMCGFT